MADDPVEEGLEKTRLELEGYAAELERSVSREAPPEPPARVDEGRNNLMDEAGKVVAVAIGDILRSSVRSFFERPRQPGRWKFTSRSQAVAAPASPPAAAAPAPVESGRPKAEVPGPGLDFVGFVVDRVEARNSTRFPAEHMSGHLERLDINRTELPSRPKMRGPVIGSGE